MASAAQIPVLYYQRLSARERTLVWIVAGTIFVLANLVAVTSLASAFGQLRRACAEQAVNLRVQRLFAADQPMWAQRQKWLHTKQPVLASRDRAGVGLQEQIQALGRGSVVLITNFQIKPLAPAAAEAAAGSADYQAVAVEFDTQSDWTGLVKFIGGVQQPDNFLVFDLASLRSDADPATMRGHFQISKWYAPAH